MYSFTNLYQFYLPSLQLQHAKMSYLRALYICEVSAHKHRNLIIILTGSLSYTPSFSHT